MASASVLKDFLVTLGWQVDDAGFKKALSSISAITKTLQDLGKTDQGTKAAAAALQSFAKHLIEVHHKIEEGNKRSKTSFAEFAKGVAEFAKTASITAGAVAVMIERQTQMFENLFFLSQRTGASVANLLNFGSAANTVGISADAAKSAIDSMALALQLNPGLRGVYRSFGISPDQDPTKMIEQFAATMRGKSVFIQHMWADALGIPWEAVRGLIAPGGLERERASRQERERVSGVVGLTQERSTQLSKDAVRFGEELNKLGFTLARIADVSFMYALPALEFLVKHLQEGLELFGKWNDKFGGLLGDFAIFIGLVTSANIALRALGLVRGAGILSTILRTVLGIGAGTAGGAAAAGTAGSAGAGAAGASVSSSIMSTLGPWALLAGGVFGLGLGAAAMTSEEQRKKAREEGALRGESYTGTEGGFQHGGIVSINAHEGEMVLPTFISRGLMGMIDAVRGNSTGAALESPFSSAKRSAESILNWLGGMFSPKVDVDNWDDLLAKQELADAAKESGPHGGPGEPSTPSTAPGHQGGPGAELSSGTASPGAGEDVKYYTGTAPAHEAEGRDSNWKAGFNAGGIRGQTGFRVYPTEQAGIFDMMRLMRSKVYGGSGKDTLESIIKTWAPSTDKNDTAGLIARAAKYMGIESTAHINMNDPDQLARLVGAMHSGEFGGRMTVPQERINEYAKQYMMGPAAGSTAGSTQQPVPAGGAGKFSAGRNLGTINTALINSMRAAANLMPEGFRVVATSGHDTTGHVADSQHYTGNALDVKIFGPQGGIPNRGGADPTGMYARLAHLWYNKLAQNFPGVANRAEWGGEFNDVMHYDLGGRRGRNQRNDWHYLDMNAPITNTFNISSPHPEAAGRAVEDTQKRVSAIHTHNLRTAIA